MSKTAEVTLNGATDHLTNGVKRFAEERSNARRFHRDKIGDVDPRHCFGDFLLRVARRDDAGIEKEYKTVRTKAALSESASGVSGGYLVPVELRHDLMVDVGEEAIFRSRCDVEPMTSATLQLPVPDFTTAQTAGTAPYFGDMLMKFTSEAATRPETEPAMRQITLRAYDLTGYAVSSKPLYDDGGAGLEAKLRRLFARAIAWYEDYYFFQGTGVGQPMGIITSAGSIAETRQTATSFTVQDIGKMSADLYPGGWVRSIWVVNPTVWPKLVVMNTTAWQSNQPFPEGPGQPHFVLNGRSGFVSDKLPALGTKGDVCYFDPSQYVIGDRMAVEIEFSADEATTWLKSQVAWRVTERIDGQPKTSKTMTAADGSSVIAPYVILN